MSFQKVNVFFFTSLFLKCPNLFFFVCIKAARCDCCKSQGTLREKVQWRGEMKHFCDQHCLLRFYCQQNEPNLATQKGPENLQYGKCCLMAAQWKQNTCFKPKIEKLFIWCNKLACVRDRLFYVIIRHNLLICSVFLNLYFVALLRVEMLSAIELFYNDFL